MCPRCRQLDALARWRRTGVHAPRRTHVRKRGGRMTDVGRGVQVFDVLSCHVLFHGLLLWWQVNMLLGQHLANNLNLLPYQTSCSGEDFEPFYFREGVDFFLRRSVQYTCDRRVTAGNLLGVWRFVESLTRYKRQYEYGSRCVWWVKTEGTGWCWGGVMAPLSAGTGPTSFFDISIRAAVRNCGNDRTGHIIYLCGIDSWSCGTATS